jgi:DNA primase small subunit
LIFDIDGDCSEGEYMGMLRTLGGHTKTLIDEFLVEDFGIPLEDIRIEFSGKKGFHVTVLSESWKTLTKEARRQLVDYIEGSKVDKGILFPEKKGYIMCNPNAKGWRKYARRTIEDLLRITEGRSAEDIEPLLLTWGFPKVRAKKISDLLTQPKIRQAVLEGRLSPLTSKGERTLNDLMRIVVKQHNLGLGGCIDRKVTFDINRIIRVPGTLHCKSGFPCLTITYEDLTNPVSIFDKIRETVGTDPITIRIAIPTSVEIDTGVIELGIGKHTLPRYIAIASLSQITYD